jgi:hypothetical protein
MARQRRYVQRYPHEPGVYRRGWVSPRGPAWFVQVRVAGKLEYHGTFGDEAVAVAVARSVRRRAAQRPEVVHVPVPIVTGKVEVPVEFESPWAGFGR